ncbi:MAG TPA: sugar ABC transporter permease [Firmicutes bacterium]|jgi:arabinogalactan oligomer/maltooligosaccharide transport system permease protein|nr:sugar ABC transporter permease [Bacillota bacterium]HBT18065.1 sugar ABC transporter permease [Bacillota bacterium]
METKKVKTTAKALLGLSPVLFIVGAICLLPIFHNVYLSLTNFSIYRYFNYTFIGLKNYVSIFGNEMARFGGMLVWTFSYSFLALFFSFFIGTFLAILLNKKQVRLRKVYRTFLIIPWAVPAFITLLMWRGLLNYNFGAINGFLEMLNLPKVPWLLEPNLARFCAVFVTVWLGFPFFMVTVLGMLQSIPAELYEAASIDGSSEFNKFKRITLPLLLRPMLPVMILNFIMNFNNFGVYLLTEGGPAIGSAMNPGATDLMITYIFRLAFSIKRYGLAAAYAVIIFVFLAIFYLISVKVSEKFVGEL